MFSLFLKPKVLLWVILKPKSILDSATKIIYSHGSTAGCFSWQISSCSMLWDLWMKGTIELEGIIRYI